VAIGGRLFSFSPFLLYLLATFISLLSFYHIIFINLDLLENFIGFIKEKHLFHKNDVLLLAVSGGIDSCVLCHLCQQAGFNFKIAHCNFQLRGAESERDEAFVQSLGEKYDVEVFIKKMDTETYAAENKVSIQVAARELRYSWFYELVRKKMTEDRGQMIEDRGQMTDDRGEMINNIGEMVNDSGEMTGKTDHRSPTTDHHLSTIHILTAHHANDNVETLLMNFFKGTGIQGLKGIEAKAGDQNKLVRPLLFAKRADIEQYAAEHQLPFVEDSSNTEEKYTRNYFRNQLIPAVQKVFPQVEDNLINNIKRFGEIASLYQQSIEGYKKKLISKRGSEVHIPVLRLLQIDAVETVLYEIIKEYNFSAAQSSDVIKLLKSDSGKYVQSSSHRVIKNRNWLIIAPIQTLLAQNILIEEGTAVIDFEQGKLKFDMFQNEQFTIAKENTMAQLDAEKIQFPLLLRKWKQGDYFYPLGMEKKKKISRFFIDKKLSITEKEKIWVLEMDKKIIWVIGLRIDNRFKITDITKNILQITLTLA
jgi:tRNA(Ile)-lysidine synthase